MVGIWLERWLVSALSVALLPFCLGVGGPVSAAVETQLTFGFNHFGYREFSHDEQVLDEENGITPRAQFSVRSIDQHGWIGGVDLMGSYGDADYEGLTQRGEPHTTRTKQTLGRQGLFGGKRFETRNTFLDFELLYNDWRWMRDIRSRNNVQGFYEEYRWHEIAGRSRITWFPRERIFFRLGLQQGLVESPQVKVDLNSSGLGTVKLRMGERAIQTYTFEWAWRWSRRGIIGGQFYYERWGFGRSPTIEISDRNQNRYQITEPYSKTEHMGSCVFIQGDF